MIESVKRACGLCEASCGLVMDVEDNRIVSVRPDYDDPHSEGYVCPKGMAIAEVHDDPDRLRGPLRKTADGNFEPIGWDEAFDLRHQALEIHGLRIVLVTAGCECLLAVARHRVCGQGDYLHTGGGWIFA
jgi:anaerobic selenocysteine-containing dehydrogenase